MPFSTSSFERYLASRPWILILGMATAIFACFVTDMELQLVHLRYKPTISSDRDYWVDLRIRADKLGSKALVIIGASRIQLGLDLDVLRRKTGLEPVQLAIDGSSPNLILEGLAKDPKFKGIVIVDYYTPAIGTNGGAGNYFQKAFETEDAKPFSWLTGHDIEKYLTKLLHENLRVYSDGANPWLSFTYRILVLQPQSQYLITMADRSRKADYTKVQMPDFYYSQVARTLGIQVNAKEKNIEFLLRQKVNEQAALINSNDWHKKVEGTRKLVEAIQTKGGKVVFVGMPSSGMVREIEELRYPKAQYWDYFVQNVGAPAIHSNYTPILRGFGCPIG